MSLIEESPNREVRMANLALVGTHSTNGVAAIHSELLKKTVVPDFAEMFPDRFSNKTNGVTPRRWLLMANPGLADVISEEIGNAWTTNLEDLRKILPLKDDAGFHLAFRGAKQLAKTGFAEWLKKANGKIVDPEQHL